MKTSKTKEITADEHRKALLSVTIVVRTKEQKIISVRNNSSRSLTLSKANGKSNTELNNSLMQPHNSNNNSSTSNSNSSLFENDNEVLQTIEYIGNVLCFYYVPIIVGTGTIGNILSVVVFFKTKLRKLSSSFYLAALAVSDTCFLFGLFIQWLNFMDVHIYNREYFCQFFTFFSNLACFCSVWFVVAFTVERFIAVMYPLKRQTMCTVRRAKMVLLGLTLLGCLHCAPFWISSTPVYLPKLEITICDIKNEYKDYITLLNYWDTVVVFAVPFTTIAVLNTFTGCTVWKFATVRRTLTMQK
ncbi:cysteinyl leukotriene receptor 1-like [Musca vetustissima]|uniref:cysteinyl leukotriene receptor 1-like n=1 Tax=Musca vetustissima TaxID=27455 RepID=UPI002AB70223|nr:cysteinyl leukotriene receptor 1-like [Musca vetustissima]